MSKNAVECSEETIKQPQTFYRDIIVIFFYGYSLLVHVGVRADEKSHTVVSVQYKQREMIGYVINLSNMCHRK